MEPGNRETAEQAGRRIDELEREVARLSAENEKLRAKGTHTRETAKSAIRLFVGKRLSSASAELKEQMRFWHDGLIEGPPTDAIVDFAEASVRRWVRVGIFGFMAAMIPTMAIIVQTTLLARQNRMIGEQNALFVRQNALMIHQSSLMEAQNDRLDKQNGLMEIQNKQLLRQNTLLVEERQAGREHWAESHKVRLLEILYLGMDKACTSGETNRRRGGVPAGCHPSAAIREREQAVQLYINLERERPSLDGARVSLAFLNLQDGFLPRVDMAGVDLYGALFFNTKLRSANLQGTVFRNAIMDECDLRDANLKGADLRGALLVNADLRNADLTDALVLPDEGDDDRSTFETRLDGVSWEGATCPDGTKAEGEPATCEGHFLSSK